MKANGSDGVDAVLVEDDLKTVFIVQGKYRVEVGKKGKLATT
jgi:hypothetical protein